MPHKKLAITLAQMSAAKKKIGKHYRLKREVTDAEVTAEVKNLIRKCGDWDDCSENLAATLQTGPHPIEIHCGMKELRRKFLS